MERKLNLWVFWYNSMVYESSSFPISYHKTKKGAIATMKAHKALEYEEHLKSEEWNKEFSESNGFKYKPSKFGKFQMWEVEKFELEILD